MSVKRNPIRTRDRLLDSAYRRVGRVGFREAALADILADAGVTKGALYHHFADKRTLGYALCEERLEPRIVDAWIAPLEAEADPVDAILGMLADMETRLTDEQIARGCPLGALAAEMSAIDEGFRRRLDMIYAAWVDALADALDRGRAAGTVRTDVDPAPSALFIVGALAGARTLAQTAQSRDVLRACVHTLAAYLRGLRPA